MTVVLAILLLIRSPVRSLMAYMVAIFTMIWGLGAWEVVSNILTSPWYIAVSPNQLTRPKIVYIRDVSKQPVTITPRTKYSCSIKVKTVIKMWWWVGGWWWYDLSHQNKEYFVNHIHT